ncbi:hypothetical protein ACR9E3_28745 [Actinomycetospora sp. C-140]
MTHTLPRTLSRTLVGGVLGLAAFSGSIGAAGVAVAAPADPPPCDPTSSGCRAPNLTGVGGPLPGPADPGEAQQVDVFQKGLEACAGSGVPDAAPTCDFVGQLYGPVRQANPND